jgi:hypothetical protein
MDRIGGHNEAGFPACEAALVVGTLIIYYSWFSVEIAAELALKKHERDHVSTGAL